PLEGGAEGLGHHAGDGGAGAARPERINDRDRLARIALRARAAGKRREGSSARGQLQEASTGKVHGSLLGHVPSSSHSWLGVEQRPRAGELTACLAGKQRLKLQQQSGLRLY